jgi:hypothetical protein
VPELAQIKYGALQNYTGAGINTGIDTWWAYDAQRYLFLRAEGMDLDCTIGACYWATLHPPTKLASNQVLRKSARVRYVVTIIRATPEQARKFACVANEIAKWSFIHGDNPVTGAGSVTAASPDSGLPDSKLEHNGSSEVTVFARKPDVRDMKTDTYSESFEVLADGRPVSGGISVGCGPTCLAGFAKKNGDLSSYVSQSGK